MKYQIRKGVFETNSSSVHTLVISNEIPEIDIPVPGTKIDLSLYEGNAYMVQELGGFDIRDWDERRDSELTKEIILKGKGVLFYEALCEYSKDNSDFNKEEYLTDLAAYFNDTWGIILTWQNVPQKLLDRIEFNTPSEIFEFVKDVISAGPDEKNESYYRLATYFLDHRTFYSSWADDCERYDSMAQFITRNSKFKETDKVLLYHDRR